MAATDRDAVTEARVALTPTVVAALRGVATAATELADALEENPGQGLGFLYAGPFQAWSVAEVEMRRYQNEPLS